MKSTLTLLLFVIVSSNNLKINAQFAGGSGTEEDPYQISSIEHLQSIKDYLQAYYIQTNNIDGSETRNWNNGGGFEPLGDRTLPFSGNYDGNNFTITKLFINRPSETYVGLFGYNSGAKFKNIILDSLNITGKNLVGGLIGYSTDFTGVDNVIVLGKITGTWRVGGLAGMVAYTKVEKSGAEANVNGHEDVGGLIGKALGSELYDTYSKSNDIGNDSSEKVGGLVGLLDGYYLLRSYSVSSVNGKTIVGGLVGLHEGFSEIDMSYSASNVFGESLTGLVVGANYSTLKNGYSDTTKTKKIPITGSGNYGEFVGLSSEQMTMYESKRNMTIFDFENVWKLTKQYPALQWENVASLPPLLSSPFNEQVNVGTLTEFTWNEVESSVSYHLQVSTDNQFSSFVFDSSKVGSTSFTLSEPLSENTTYYWRIKSISDNELRNSEWSDTLTFTTGVRTSIEDELIPQEYILSQNYPNPFNPSTQIKYALPEATQVTLDVFNSLGQKVIELVNGQKSAGYHTATFDASGLSSGVYLYKLTTPSFTQTKKMLLIK